MTTTAIASAPKHGAVRNARVEPQNLTGAELCGPGGRTFVAYAGRDIAVAEVYCAFCRDWFETRGLMAALLFTADHRHGEAGPAFPLDEAIAIEARASKASACDRGPGCRFTKCTACGDPDLCTTHRICGTCGTRA